MPTKIARIIFSLVFFGFIVALGISTFFNSQSGPSVDSPLYNENENSEDAPKGDFFQWPAKLEDEKKIVTIEKRGAKNYYIVFDGSGSMFGRECGEREKILVAKDVVSGFVDKIPKDANIGIAAFDSRGLAERAPLSGDNKDKVVNAIKSIQAAGETPLKSSISLAANKLAKQAAYQMGYGEYHLVIVTDGEASSGEEPLDIVNALLSHTPIVIHTVGFCISDNHSLNQKGRILYRSASNAQELERGLDDILAESESFGDGTDDWGDWK
jgi:Ca-activated chloride channel family protein